MSWRMWARRFINLTSYDDESEHWPFIIGLTNRLQNSLRLPSRFGLTKFTIQWSGKTYIHNIIVNEMTNYVNTRIMYFCTSKPTERYKSSTRSVTNRIIHKNSLKLAWRYDFIMRWASNSRSWLNWCFISAPKYKAYSKCLEDMQPLHSTSAICFIPSCMFWILPFIDIPYPIQFMQWNYVVRYRGTWSRWSAKYPMEETSFQ